MEKINSSNDSHKKWNNFIESDQSDSIKIPDLTNSQKNFASFQLSAITDHGFTLPEVQEKSFGVHTVAAVVELKKLGKTEREAINMVTKLNPSETSKKVAELKHPLQGFLKAKAPDGYKGPNDKRTANKENQKSQEKSNKRQRKQ